LEAVFSTLGPNLDQLTKQFIETLIDGRRVNDLHSIARKFVEYYKLLNKEEGVTIISARALSTEQKSRVKQTLEEAHSGTTFTIKYEVD
jgi:F0F1-type ATP synthase delta subunit